MCNKTLAFEFEVNMTKSGPQIGLLHIAGLADDVHEMLFFLLSFVMPMDGQFLRQNSSGY
jgi:hypothetical protein